MTTPGIDQLASGQWLLTAADWDLETQPLHGMKLVFHNEPAGLRGCWVNWGSGEEVPLTEVMFDGTNLEIDMSGLSRNLKMEAAGDIFVGSWTGPVPDNIPVPRLKMVKLPA
jgi:hypothetical protein